MKRFLNYLILTAAIILLFFFSVNLKRIDRKITENQNGVFDADQYAIRFWENDLPSALEKAPDADHILKQLMTAKDKAIEEYAQVLGISDTYYFLVKGEGYIRSVENEYLIIETNENNSVRIATDFIFGNALRDGSGIVDIDGFMNMTDFNNVSIAINRLIKERVIEGFRDQAEEGMKIRFSGAFEVNADDYEPDGILIIPVSVIIQK